MEKMQMWSLKYWSKSSLKFSWHHRCQSIFIVNPSVNKNCVSFHRLRSNGIGATVQSERLGYFSHQGQTKHGRKVYVREQNGQRNQYLYFWDWGPNNGANWIVGLDPQLKPRGTDIQDSFRFLGTQATRTGLIIWLFRSRMDDRVHF